MYVRSGHTKQYFHNENENIFDYSQSVASLQIYLVFVFYKKKAHHDRKTKKQKLYEKIILFFR